MYFTECSVAACHTRFTDLTVHCTQINVCEVHRLRINKWAGLDGGPAVMKTNISPLDQ